jgi:hypothetical protein
MTDTEHRRRVEIEKRMTSVQWVAGSAAATVRDGGDVQKAYAEILNAVRRLTDYVAHTEGGA